MSLKSAVQDLFAIWLSIMDVSVVEILKGVPKDKSCDDISMKALIGVTSHSYIEFCDVLSFAESSFEDGKAERWAALRNSVPFRRGVNLGSFSENPRCIFISFHFKFFIHGGPINQEW